MREFLIQYGMDWDRTMERFGYDESLYAECLTMLMDDPNPQSLHEALESGNLPAAFEAAHTLKGVAANMGLIPLLSAISALVEPLRHSLDADYPALLAAFDHELSQVRALHSRLSDHQ